jgi:hypothetical protein
MYVKFGAGYFDKNLREHLFRENRRTAVLSVLFHIIVRWCKRSAHVAVNSCEFHDDWCREGPALRTECGSITAVL